MQHETPAYGTRQWLLAMQDSAELAMVKVQTICSVKMIDWVLAIFMTATR